jgi:hypothetical protein
MTVWCLWWRVCTDRASPVCVVEEETEKGGFRNWAAAPRKIGHPNRRRTDPFYMWRLTRVSYYLHDIQDGQTALNYRHLADLIWIRSTYRRELQRPKRPLAACPGLALPQPAHWPIRPSPNSERARSSSLAARRDRASQDALAAALGRPPPFFPFLSTYFC